VLAASGDLYRRPAYAGGLLQASDRPNSDPIVIDNARRLASVIVDRVRVRTMKNGDKQGWCIPSAHMQTMLASEAFLQEFRPVDAVVKTGHYLPGFCLMRPGYNDGGPGMRVLHAGPEVRVERSAEAITRFLEVMAFAGNADRTNAVAAALTVLLRRLWPGGKPLVALTSTKSHGGKNTLVDFAAGATPPVSISYQSTDWAFKNCFIAAVKHSPSAGVVHIDNARLEGGQKHIASAFLEQILTDPEPLLYSPGRGSPLKSRNQLVVALSTQYGTIAEDLMNRALPIRLAPVGDVASRISPIGNPRFEYLPEHRDQIQAELRGMVEKWKEEGRPLDHNVRHPFTDWARTIGGILQANGFDDFLANYTLRRTADDPVRKALGLLGAARPGEWLRADAWARLAAQVGVARAVIPEHGRDTDKGRERGVGVVLSAHQGETFFVETDDETLNLRLEKRRARFDGGQPTTRYMFVVQERSPIPEDPTPDEKSEEA
jgi:hypothetical protein